MASFTDLIPQFNPYIQQLPVEAMVSVGMEKQKRYDEGLQKIQSQINNVAGLDIYKDADKAYLQSKLGELGNNLKVVAAGDFSNFQLVNSVSGMTNQIIKDKNVQNAISSTKRIRQEQSYMDEDRRKGTLHVNNENFFNEQIQNYLNNDTVGEVFGSRYQPYTDYQKKWREVQKSLGVKETQTDLPFLMNNKGQFIDEKGNLLPPGARPIPNDYMVRETFKGVDPERLKQAIMVSMDDNDYRQMQIDAHFSYKGYTPQMLADQAYKSYTTDRKDLEETITSLNILKNQHAGDNQMLDKINAKISAYTKKVADDDAEFKSTIDQLPSNPEGFKTKLFVRDTINSFANNFSDMSHIQNIVTSPIRQQMNEDRNYNFKVIEFDTKNKQWEKDFKLKQTTETRLTNKEAFDQAVKLYELGLGPNPLGPGAGKYVGAPPTDADVLDGMLQSFKQGADIDRLTADKNELKMGWAKNQSTKTDVEKQLGRKMTDAEYRAFLEDQFNNDLAAYNRDRNSITSPATRRVLDQYSELDKLYKLKVNAISNVQQQVDDMFSTTEKDVVDKMNREKGLGNYSPSQIYNINNKVSKYIKPGATRTSTTGAITSEPTKFDDDGARKNLTADEYKIYEGYKNSYFGKGDAFINDFKNKAFELTRSYGKVYGNILKQKDEYFAKSLNETINALAPVASNLPKGAMTALLPMIEEKFGREQKGETEELTGFVKGKDFDMNTLRGLSLAPDVKPMYTTWGDNVFITLTGTVGKNIQTQKFKISKDEFNRTFPALADNTDTDFLQSAAANGSTNYKYARANTALKDKNEAFTSAGYTIPSSKYIVKGDIFFDQTDKNSTLPVIWVKSKKTGNVIAIPSNEYSSFSGASKSMSQINDLTIENYLKNNKLDADF